VIGWEDYYSHDIFRVEGFPRLILQIDELSIVMVYFNLFVFPARNIVNLLIKLSHSYQMHDIACLC